jgi:hypothetical protein
MNTAVAHSGSAAPQTMAVHDGMAYLALRLTFGGSPNPPTWYVISELVTDLANEICQCKDWDPTNLNSPVQPTAPEPVYVAEAEAPLAPALPMAVEIPPIERGEVDGFIDDLIHVFWDTPSNRERLPHAVPLAITDVERQLRREPFESRKKGRKRILVICLPNYYHSPGEKSYLKSLRINGNGRSAVPCTTCRGDRTCMRCNVPNYGVASHHRWRCEYMTTQHVCPNRYMIVVQ